MYNIKESSKRLSELRKRKNITQDQVALDLGMSVDTVRKNEQGVRGLSVDSALIYAEYYGTTVDYILNGKKDTTVDICGLLDGISDEKKEMAIKILKGILENL